MSAPTTREHVVEVTTRDLETGESETAPIPAGDYVLICTEPCYLAHVAEYPGTGTVVLTIKGRIAR